MEQPTYRHQSEIAFSDTDASGWAHFSKILCHVEAAEHACLTSKQIPVFSDNGGWPRVKISCDYRSPLRYGDRFEVMLHLQRIGTTSINWRFEILKTDNTIAAAGEMVSVKVDSDGKPTSITDTEHSKFLTIA